MAGKSTIFKELLVQYHIDVKAMSWQKTIDDAAALVRMLFAKW